MQGRAYTPLVAPSIAVVRTKAQQMPTDTAGHDMLAAIHRHFAGRSTDFESCAVALWRLIAPWTGRCDFTQPSRDGGRDAVGEYLLGPIEDRVTIDFALEAKCYGPNTPVGVEDVSRLISRIKYRNFGVFATLSHFGQQVYDVVRTDGHPIVMICGSDIVEVLNEHGYRDVTSVNAWLANMFPPRG